MKRKKYFVLLIFIIIILAVQSASTLQRITTQSADAYSIWGSDSYIYVVGGHDNLYAYTSDGSSLTKIATVDAGHATRGVWGNDTTVFVSGDEGLKAYSFDGSSFSHIATIDNASRYWRLWFDGTYIYTTCDDEGLFVYSFDGTNFTLIDSIDDGGDYEYIWVNENSSFIYAVSTGPAGAVMAYLFDGTNLFLNGTLVAPGSWGGIWGNGSYIYISTTHGSSGPFKVYTFNGTNFNLVAEINDGAPTWYRAYTVWGNDRYIYTGCGPYSNEVLVYSFNGTNLSLYAIYDPPSAYSHTDIWGDPPYVYIASFSYLSVYSYPITVVNCTALSVETQAATLQGELFSGDGVSCTCGFWFGNKTTSQAKVDAGITNNVTCSGTYTTGETFSTTTGNILTAGEYYYIRAWAYTSDGFNVSDESYFLTKPNPPTSLSATCTGITNITLTWINSVVGDNTNQTTLIRYKTGSYPTTITDGTLFYNGTATTNWFNGFAEETTYFFSAWTYINASGSPFLWWYSDPYGYTSGSTTGGNYTVHVRYEDNGTYVNLSDVNMTHTFRAKKSSGELLYTCHPTNSTGMFNFETDELVEVATFTYNSLCERSVLVDPNERNITFYISAAEEDVYIGNLTVVTINFVDPMNILTIEKNPTGWIYKYNETGRQYIHMDYLQADLSLRTWLVIGETYYVGVGSSAFTIDNLGALSIYNQAEFDITVMSADMGNITSSSWYRYFSINQSFTGGIITVDFVDTSFNALYGGVQSALIKLYYHDNSTLIETVDAADIGVPWQFTYNYVGDSSVKYEVHIIVQYLYNHTVAVEGTSQDYTEQWTKTIYLYFWEGPEPIIVPDEFDDKLNNTVGLTPMYYIDEDGVEHIVSWSATIVIFLAMVPLLLFGREFAGFGIIGCGIILYVLAFGNVIQMLSIENIALATLLILIGILVHLATKKGG